MRAAEEFALTQLCAKRAAELKERAPRALPSPTAIAGYLDNLLGVLQTDTVRGRELLSRFVSPIILTPETENPRGPLSGNRGERVRKV